MPDSFPSNWLGIEEESLIRTSTCISRTSLLRNNFLRTTPSSFGAVSCGNQSSFLYASQIHSPRLRLQTSVRYRTKFCRADAYGHMQRICQQVGILIII